MPRGCLLGGVFARGCLPRWVSAQGSAEGEVAIRSVSVSVSVSQKIV